VTTFAVQNFGCRATQADAATIERQLLDRGLRPSTDAYHAEIVVLNTCTVTAAADARARDAIRHIHARNGQTRILVTGCYAQRAPEELAAMDGVSWVVGNSHQREIANLILSPSEADPGPIAARPGISNFVSLAALSSDAMSLARGPAKILTGDIFAETEVTVAPGAYPAPGEAASRTRPTVKIQDGCDNHCSYCIIPFVRGNSRSLPPSNVLAEIERLVSAGAREIVLSGINLGSYGRDLSPRASLEALLRRILDETGVERLRLSSIEPMDVTQDFVELVAASGRIAPHFHMPLQSASDRVLRLMRRWYRAAHYERRIELIRERLPDAGIGADVIAGFPGETAEDFQATLEFVERLSFTYLHVFSFSPRPGTHAEKLSGPVLPAVVRERARRLRATGERQAADFRAAQAGSVHRALTLRRRGDTWTEALTGNFLKIRVTGTWPANTWVDACLTADGSPAACFVA